MHDDIGLDGEVAPLRVAQRDDAVISRLRAAEPTVAQLPATVYNFGDIRDPQSEVSRWKASQRDYALLGELNNRPRTTYLARLRNPNPEWA